MWFVLTPCGETFYCSSSHGSTLHSDGGVKSPCPYVVLTPVLPFIFGTNKWNWNISLVTSWISVVFLTLSEDKNVFQREYNNTYIILFACYMVINTTAPLRFRVFQAISKKKKRLLSPQNISSHIQIQNIEFKQLYFVLWTFSHIPLLHIIFF